MDAKCIEKIRSHIQQINSLLDESTGESEESEDVEQTSDESGGMGGKLLAMKLSKYKG